MDVLSWEAHPLKESAPRSWFVAAALLGICLLMNPAFGGWLWSVLAVVFLGGVLSRWLLPTRYRLDAAGVESRFLGMARRRPWSDFRAAYPHAMGLHLSPFERPSPRDPFRGLFLRYSGNGPAVEAFCRARLGGGG